jgi:hypothetical protein
VAPAMKFHVAREGAVLGEFEEQIFRNKVFSGEIRPNDLYWIAGFTDWRPVSEFRVARKTERERVPQRVRVEAKTAIARGQLRAGMTADQCMRMLGEPARIKRISGSKNEQWTYKGPEGPVILHFESGLLQSF